MAKRTKNTQSQVASENETQTTTPPVVNKPVVDERPKKELLVVDMTDPKVAAAEEAKKVEVVSVTPPIPEPKPRVQSTVASPVKLVWQIATDMKAKDPNVRRKDVVDACVKAGVALHTARTQFQRWFKKSASNA
jgi:hypothetical protein